ncbi:hypothetical protein [Butyrivibrio sp. LC3010]|uniref:hypothetical protein n=1 Tax=Butyrivibrio sp. LC3010 TaxID=1280680 RepID=UPI0004224DC0|nr:hypothetical protein [Butyrivibrio sp. LC3010]
MIKIDPLRIKDFQKRMMIGMGIISILSTIYTLVFILVSKYLESKDTKRIHIILGHVGILIISFLWIAFSDFSVVDFIRPYLSYIRNLLHVDPARILIADFYSLAFLFLGNRISEGVDDWIIENERDMRNELLPIGSFDYTDRSHMLLFGATRTGKGVAINHIMKFILTKRNKELLVVVSAKPASGDKHSQLAYLRKLCKATGRKLYVVSMDESVKDRCQYNPFKHLKKDEMRNALSGMLDFDSEYYRKNFVQWVMSIFKLIRKGKETVSISNILKLYDWDAYKGYANQLLDKEIITEEEYRKLTDSRIHRYADVAVNDSANLDDVVDACSSVFLPTPNKKKITITDAFKTDAVIYFDLNGSSAADSVKMLGGACIMAELQHCMVAFSDSDKRKTVIFDEASYYINADLTKVFFNTSASMGYQFIISTQGPSDLYSDTDTLKHQLNNNMGQLACLRVSDPEDVDMINGIIGTTIGTENTHRALSIDYDMTGSLKAVDQMHVSHNLIKNLEPLHMIYYQKKKSVDGEARPVMVVWDTDDL